MNQAVVAGAALLAEFSRSWTGRHRGESRTQFAGVGPIVVGRQQVKLLNQFLILADHRFHIASGSERSDNGCADLSHGGIHDSLLSIRSTDTVRIGLNVKPRNRGSTGR